MYMYLIYHIYIFTYTIKSLVSTELHLWLDVWVPLAALSGNFLGRYLFFNRKVHFCSRCSRCSFLKQNWLAPSTNFSLSTCFL